MPKMTKEMLDKLVAARVAEALGQAAPDAKPKRVLKFAAYVNDVKTDANAATFGNAIASGNNAASVYAHGTAARHAVSALTLREVLSDPIVAQAARAFLSALK